LCNRASAGLVGNSIAQPVWPGIMGTHPGAATVLITCQRSGRYASPMLAGRKLAVSSRSLERVTVAAIALPRPGPSAATGV